MLTLPSCATRADAGEIRAADDAALPIFTAPMSPLASDEAGCVVLPPAVIEPAMRDLADARERAPVTSKKHRVASPFTVSAPSGPMIWL